MKFKAKAWIDVFGARGMKACGSLITNAARDKPELLASYGSVPTLLISFALLGIAILVGKQFEDLIRLKITVGDDDSVRLVGKSSRPFVRTHGGNSSPRIDWTQAPPKFPVSALGSGRDDQGADSNGI